jgi:lytic murein transglycosylase
MVFAADCKQHIGNSCATGAANCKEWLFAKPARHTLQAVQLTRIIIGMIAKLIRSSNLRTFTLASLAALLAGTGPAQAIEASPTYKRNAQKAFGSFMEGLWPEAKARGISRKVFDASRKRIKLQWDIPDLAPPKIKGEQPHASRKRQAEFGSPGRYFRDKSLNQLAQIGRRNIAKYARTFDQIEQRTGVDKEVVAAIWGRETAFSGAKIPHDAMSVLATQAFLGRRPEFFRPELLAIMEIAQHGTVPVSQLKSSWAGAMGHTQMLPGLYLKYASDGDGDGKSEIWNSIPDALATTATFLKASGWKPGLSWAYEVEPSVSLDCTLEGSDAGRPIADWITSGATRVAGRKWSQRLNNVTGYLIMPAGRFGPAFVATDNYYAIKNYNESDLYVLYVGNLADRIAGGGAFKTSWKSVDTFTRATMQKAQRKMVALGYNVGDTIDGLIGFRTRTATGMHQKKLGMAVDCWPNKPFIARLK